MPDLLEHMYCAQQINIPPNLPYILKQYAKAAIRTQPYDLLYWSAAYFRAKANNMPPPVKERLEYPPFDSPSRLSPGFLRVLHKQLENYEYVRVEILYEKWLGVCLVKEALNSMLKIGNIQHRVPWLKFVAIAAGHICMSLGKTMVLICEVLTDQPDGGAAWIPVEKFVELYHFLALLNCGPDPPVVKHVEVDVPTPSVTSTHVSSSVPEEEAKSIEVDEKDSTVGLMVLPDIKPQHKSDRVRTPKAADEPGATSELGVEVYDDAKGPVTELVTLYPAPTKTQASGHQGVTVITESSSKVGTKPHETESMGESILSHTSLKENEDWITVEAKDLDEEGRESEPLDLDKLDSGAASKTELSGKRGTKGEEKSGIEAAGELKEDQDKPVEISDDRPKGTTLKDTEDKASRKDGLSEADNISKKTTEKEGTSHETGEEMGSKIGMEAQSEENVLDEGAPSQATLDSQEKTEDSSDSEPKKAALESTDSEYALDEAITMTNFVKTREIGYSIVEIRRGRYGDKSLDHIEFHEDGPVASPTVHRLSVESQESVETQANEPKQPYWDHVPGIGPVIPEDQIRAVVEYMQYWASKQQGMVGPRNINHLLCPPLDLPPAPEDDVSMY